MSIFEGISSVRAIKLIYDSADYFDFLDILRSMPLIYAYHDDNTFFFGEDIIRKNFADLFNLITSREIDQILE